MPDTDPRRLEYQRPVPGIYVPTPQARRELELAVAGFDYCVVPSESVLLYERNFENEDLSNISTIKQHGTAQPLSVVGGNLVATTEPGSGLGMWRFDDTPTIADYVMEMTFKATLGCSYTIILRNDKWTSLPESAFDYKYGIHLDYTLFQGEPTSRFWHFIGNGYPTNPDFSGIGLSFASVGRSITNPDGFWHFVVKQWGETLMTCVDNESAIPHKTPELFGTGIESLADVDPGDYNLFLEPGQIGFQVRDATQGVNGTIVDGGNGGTLTIKNIRISTYNPRQEKTVGHDMRYAYDVSP